MSGMDRVKGESSCWFKPAELPLWQRDGVGRRVPLVSLEEFRKRYESYMMEHDPQWKYREARRQEWRDQLPKPTDHYGGEGIVGGEWGDLSGGADLIEMAPAQRKLHQFYSYVANGGTDVQRLKDALGITDKFLRSASCPMTAEEYQEESKRLAMEYMGACFAKLQQTTHPGVEFELVSVPDLMFSLTMAMPGVPLTHIHFNAKRQNSDLHQQSPELFCAVILRHDRNRVIGCNLLETNCNDAEAGLSDEKKCVLSKIESGAFRQEIDGVGGTQKYSYSFGLAKC